MVAVSMLSSRIRSQPAVEQRTQLVEVGDLDLDGHVGEPRPHRLEGRDHAAGGDHVVVLDHRHVGQAEPVVDAPAAPHGVLLQGAPAGQGLAGVEHPGGGALERGDPVRGRGGDTGEVAAKLSAVRSAQSSPRTGPSTRITTSPAAVPGCRRGPGR